MATLAHVYKPSLTRIALTKILDELTRKIIPRPCMLASVGLILVGMAIPLLMVIGVLQPGLMIGLVGFNLVATGGVLALIFCGEI